MPASSWCVYILKCHDGSLYTGVARDLEKRLACHRSGRGSKFVRSRLPVKVVYVAACRTRSSAQKKEAAIKKMPRQAKVELILTQAPDLRY